MITVVHKANTRGHANHGWLDTHHTFSFANYWDPERVHFGNLRVLNDDIIAAGTGFGKHPHDNMEIITVPITGKVLHQDSMGHTQTIGVNEVQVMSAGTGIFHSEYNASETDDLSLLQIWILPEKRNIKPVYNQLLFDSEMAQNRWQILVDDENGPLKINQHAVISRIFLDKGKEVSYSLKRGSERSYLFVIEGSVEMDGVKFDARDGVGLEETNEFKMKALTKALVLNIEL
ncbi:MAG TPA: pirin family protein [Prolixibacteraceae bacterium]|nr:pirin family protein [Prolixibacteraceae bacterium]